MNKKKNNKTQKKKKTRVMTLHKGDKRISSIVYTVPHTKKNHQSHDFSSGTYGCVYRPSLLCRNSTRIDPGSVSKLMTEVDAEEEMHHYTRMSLIDPTFSFHLKTPDLCTPNESELEEMLKCDSRRVQKYTHPASVLPKKRREFLDKLKLLIIRDGGKDFDDMDPLFTHWKMTQIRPFLQECKRLFDGIVKVWESGYTMNDIKPNNIVYEIYKNRVNYIDFGTMTRLHEYVNTLDQYSNFTFYHNYPLETYFLLQQGERYKKVGETLPDDHLYTFTKVVHHIAKQNGQLHDKRIVQDYQDMIRHIRRHRVPFATFVELCEARVDVYQLGLTMMSVLQSFGKRITAPLRLRLFHLFYYMMHPNVFKRLGPREAAARYDDIMKKTM